MSVVRVESLDLAKAEGYRNTFASSDRPLTSGDQLPPAWEGIYFGFNSAFINLRADGTPARDGVLPEIDLPRRLYAGEDTEFLSPLHVGDTVIQTASAGQVTEKAGANGRLVFADIVREFAVDEAVAVRTTWHDVFLGEVDPAIPAREPLRNPGIASTADWHEVFSLDARQLFRFSALTFNTHRVHYDRPWAREVEGLPDLLVHGPLSRILLMDAARRHEPDRTARTLRLRSTAPILVGRQVRVVGTVEGERSTVTAVNDDDVVLATAEIEWA